MKVGFIPFTHSELNHKKGRHMLGNGGASNEMAAKLIETEKLYKELKAKVQFEVWDQFYVDIFSCN